MTDETRHLLRTLTYVTGPILGGEWGETGQGGWNAGVSEGVHRLRELYWESIGQLRLSGP